MLIFHSIRVELPNPSLTWWNTMPGCMTSFTLERQIFHTSIAITCNNDVVWSMNWTPPSLTSLMISCIMSPIRANTFSMGLDELEGWLWSFYFSTLGEVSSIVINLHISTTHSSSKWYSSMLGFARWPQHHHLHLQKNVNEEKQHKGVHLKT